jgi:membrane fusion protein (multidrug efflux system)
MAEKKEQHTHQEPHGHAGTAAPESKAAWYQNKGARTAGKIIGGLFVAALIGWLIFFMPYVSTDDATIDADVVKVANQGMSNQILKIYVNEGDRVKKGDVLVELDHSMAEDQLEKAEAQANFTALDLKRTDALASQQGISRQQLDKTRQAAQIAEADRKIAQLNLDRTYIKSPVDGTVIQKTAIEGNMLETNQTAIILACLDNAWVTANIEEKDVGNVKIGQKVYISIDEGGSLTGKIVDVRQAAASVFALIPSDNASGNFVKVAQRIPLKIALDPHPGKELRIGQSVVIKIKVR